MIRCVIFSLLALAVAPCLAPADWVPDGEGLNVNRSANACYPAIAMASNTPFVVWQEEGTTGYQVLAKYLSGSRWMTAGAKLNTEDCVANLFLSADAYDGTPYVSWTQGPAALTLSKFWNGTQWANLGRLNTSLNQNATMPYLHFGDSSLPVAAYLEQESLGGFYYLTAKYWDPSYGSWQPLIASSIMNDPDYSAAYPSMAASNGIRWFTWLENHKIFTARWNGTSLMSTGALNFNTNRSALWPSVAMAGFTPYVAWQEFNGLGVSQIYLKHWNGTAWVRDGDCANRDPTQNARYPRIVVHASTPYLTWYEDRVPATQVYVSYWNGTAWVPLGGALNADATQPAQYPNLAFRGETPYVAWQENAGMVNQIFVKHFEVPTTTPTLGPTATRTPTPLPDERFFKLLNNQIDPDLGGQVTVRWSQPRPSTVTITVYSLSGEKVVILVDGATYDSDQLHEVHWNGKTTSGRSVGSGIYIVHIQAEGFEERGKVAVVK